MRLERHYFTNVNELELDDYPSLSELTFIGAWERPDNGVHPDSRISFKGSQNLLDSESWEEHRKRKEEEGWIFHQEYGYGCQYESEDIDVIVAIRDIYSQEDKENYMRKFKINVEVDIGTYVDDIMSDEDENLIHELLEELEMLDKDIKKVAREKAKLVAKLKDKIKDIPYEAVELIDLECGFNTLHTKYRLVKPGYSGYILGGERDPGMAEDENKDLDKEGDN